jgi:hypothetical protein
MRKQREETESCSRLILQWNQQKNQPDNPQNCEE